MQIDILDYQRLVMADYRVKASRNKLSSLLTNPTTARIKKACIEATKKGLDKKDEKALEEFFGIPEIPKTMLQLIQKAETDDFKTLVNYLQKKTKKTDDRNIELLAWLIKFEHRPFGGFGKTVNLSEEELRIFRKGDSEKVEEEIIKRLTKDLPHGETVNPESERITGESSGSDIAPNVKVELQPTRKRPSALAISGIILAVLSFLYIGIVLLKPKGGDPDIQSFVTSVESGCMYWVVDHYEEIPCNETRNGMITIPKNTYRMKSFRKIMNNDTITEYSVGKLYYLKTDNEVECFTGDGTHPVHNERKLKKLSHTIFDKYVLKTNLK